MTLICGDCFERLFPKGAEETCMPTPSRWRCDLCGRESTDTRQPAMSLAGLRMMGEIVELREEVARLSALHPELN